jgi:adenine-specific DNA-methyltransferase
VYNRRKTGGGNLANLSKLKREKMLELLERLKKEHEDDSIVPVINEIENELQNMKYGLVWEEHSERVDEEMVDNIPVFQEVEERKIQALDENEYNFLLEGDNLHSLKLLEKTHKEKIDVIYIDIIIQKLIQFNYPKRCYG